MEKIRVVKDEIPSGHPVEQIHITFEVLRTS